MQRNTKMGFTLRKKAVNRQCLSVPPDFQCSKDFIATIINLIKELKETMLKELKV